MKTKLHVRHAEQNGNALTRPLHAWNIASTLTNAEASSNPEKRDTWSCIVVKVFIVYDTKYGNTKLSAETIVEGIREVEGVEVTVGYVKEIDIGKLVDYDALVLGAPNHMGRPSQTIKKFVNQLSELDLKASYVAVFGTYSGKSRNPDRAVKKLEKMAEKKLPSLKMISPSLSIRVKGIPGPLEEGELPKCKDFGRRIANQLMQKQ